MADTPEQRLDLDSFPNEIKGYIASFLQGFIAEEEAVDCASVPGVFGPSWSVPPRLVSGRWETERRRLLPEFPSIEVVNKVYKKVILEGVFQTLLFVFTSKEAHEQFRRAVSNSEFFKPHVEYIRKISFRFVVSEVNLMTDTRLVKSLEERLSVALNWKRLTILSFELIDFDKHPDMVDFLDPDTDENAALLSKLDKTLHNYRGRHRTEKFVVTGLIDSPVGNALVVMFKDVAGAAEADLLGPAKYIVGDAGSCRLDFKPRNREYVRHSRSCEPNGRWKERELGEEWLCTA
jgi:hypothetical protein